MNSATFPCSGTFRIFPAILLYPEANFGLGCTTNGAMLLRLSGNETPGLEKISAFRRAIASCHHTDRKAVTMFFSFSRALILIQATMVIAALCAVLCPTFGQAQNARTKATPAQTERKMPPSADFRPFGVIRQDLYDRNNPNNLRSDYPPPPAQPGQF